MSAYVVFTRTKTIDQKELEKILDWNPSNDEGASPGNDPLVSCDLGLIQACQHRRFWTAA
jgi:hypothetical protein